MATFRRALTAGASYFFTVVTQERIPLLSRPEFLSALRDAVRLVRDELPFGIVAWVVLADHLHCIGRYPKGIGITRGAGVSSSAKSVRRPRT